MPSAERTTEASVRQRNRTLLDANERLRADLAALKNELAIAYGERRQGRHRA